MTSNQRYAALNRKSDERARFLMGFGFKPATDDRGAYFVRTGFGMKPATVSVEFLQLAPNAVWRDKLHSLLRRPCVV